MYLIFTCHCYYVVNSAILHKDAYQINYTCRYFGAWQSRLSTACIASLLENSWNLVQANIFSYCKYEYLSIWIGNVCVQRETFVRFALRESGVPYIYGVHSVADPVGPAPHINRIYPNPLIRKQKQKDKNFNNLKTVVKIRIYAFFYIQALYRYKHTRTHIYTHIHACAQHGSVWIARINSTVAISSLCMHAKWNQTKPDGTATVEAALPPRRGRRRRVIT